MVVLIYHRVHPAVDPMYPNEVTAEIFEWQMKMLRNYLEPLDLEQALRMRDMGELPPGAVAVTFDDGYADNFDVALPILKRTAVPATFFVTTGYLDGGRMWNDTVFESIRRLPPGIVDLDSVGLGRREIAGFESRRQIARETIDSIKHMAPSERQMRADALARTAVTPLPNDLMMTADQVRSIEKSGMRVGAHTLTHPILRAVPGPVAQAEIEGGKDRLAAILGREPVLFAYPNGKPHADYDPDLHCAMVRSSGYLAAVSTRRGAVGRSTDRWQLPRFTPWDRTPARFLARLLLEYRRVV